MSRPPALTPVRLRLPVARVERAAVAVGHAVLGAALGRWLADGLRFGPVDGPAPLIRLLEQAWPALPALAALAGLWVGQRQARALLPPSADGAWLVRDAAGRWSLTPASVADAAAVCTFAAVRPIWDLGSALLLQARGPLRWLWLRRRAAGDGAWHALRLALREPPLPDAPVPPPGGPR